MNEANGISGAAGKSFVEIENPYRLHDSEPGDWFYHEEVITRIREIFADQSKNKVIVLYGKPGSGKTTTLKRIEENINSFGEKSIPVYLDSRDYIGLSSQDILFSVYEDIVIKINKFGYNIPEPDFVKERRQKGLTLPFIILIITSYLKNKGMVLILDEFDRLLENIDHRTISEYIEYLNHHLEMDWENYGLILSGDKRMINIVRNEAVNGLIDRAEKINIPEVFNEEVIKNSITEPLKNNVYYDSDAVDKIAWLSGRNLYYQQLICSYIVKHLNSVKDRHCTADVVEKAVEELLNDKRPEFPFIWNEKMTNKWKIIVSALADRKLTKKEGQFYFIKENSLLNCIFEGKLNEATRELHELGYINEIEGRRFSKCPFQLPIYGKWLQKEHPFIRTVIENIETIAQKVDLLIFIREIEETAEQNLAPFDKKKILEITETWAILKNSILKERDIEDKKWAERFLKLFSELIKLKFIEKSLPDSNCFLINIKNLNIGMLDEALCIIQNKPELTSSDIEDIEDRVTEFAMESQSKLSLFFYFHKMDEVERLVKKPYLSLVPIEEDDLKKVIFSISPRDAFKKLIYSKVSLQKISPYWIDGPTKTIFYGRNAIISRITSFPNKSYAIVGGRKIGKTSLLFKISDNAPPNMFYIYMNLEVIFPSKHDVETIKKGKSYKYFLESLEKEIERKICKKVEFRKFLRNRDIMKFPEVIRELSRENIKITFVFDEVDGLIQYDRENNYRLLHIFREVSHENLCQFIFAGFKELYYRKREIENPLYNFCEEIKLQPLEKIAALDLVTIPMKSIGIRFNNPKDREIILEYTGRHPNLLQIFCKNLIEKVETHDNVENRRTIFIQDIDELLDNEYENFIMDDVYLFDSDLSDIEKLVLMLLSEVHDNGGCFSVSQIQKILAKQLKIKIKREKVYRHLRNLVMRFILVDKGNDKYCFALPAFPSILGKKFKDETYKNEIVKEIILNETESL